MLNESIKCTCSNETVFSGFVTTHKKTEDGKSIPFSIKKDKATVSKTYCPFDIIEDIVTDYLYIGYLKTKGERAVNEISDFITAYGFLERSDSEVIFDDFQEDAMLLYLHLAETCQRPYPKNPEWLLEPTPAAPMPVVTDGNTVIMWQTESLSNAIELGYTLLLASGKRLGVCKNCQKPYLAKNPKREFCRDECRNVYNVRRHRSGRA